MEEIAVKVNPEAGVAIVRKVILDDKGMVDYKQGLDCNGNWITVPEGAPYPLKCVFSIVAQPTTTIHHEWVSEEVFRRLAAERNRKA